MAEISTRCKCAACGRELAPGDKAMIIQRVVILPGTMAYRVEKKAMICPYPCNTDGEIFLEDLPDQPWL